MICAIFHVKDEKNRKRKEEYEHKKKQKENKLQRERETVTAMANGTEIRISKLAHRSVICCIARCLYSSPICQHK